VSESLGLLEGEMVRRAAAVLVVDAALDPRVDQALADAIGARSFVGAPIVVEGSVIGFLYADCSAQQRSLGEFDRALLAVFAQGLGSAGERTVLSSRLRSLHHEVRLANHSIVAMTDDLCDAEVELVRNDPQNDVVARSAATLLVAGRARLDSLLTRREIDVIVQLAAGATNAAIASRLVVSEETVKSHVKHILRKLRASNRAEAVSRYIRLSQRDATGTNFAVENDAGHL
jgi:LuxR family transcriptional regulator, regulator of acetate metabolism